MFSSFEDIVENRHEHARKLRNQKNRKIIGYLCSYVPEEIIYAAGGIPVRIFSNEDPPMLSENLMQTYYCTFGRSILHQGLAGDFSYMDGLVTSYSCVTMRLVFETLQRFVGFPYSRFLHLPGIIDTPEAKEFYYKDLKRFVKDMEDISGRAITNEDLREAIHIYDENRSLIRKIFGGRKGEPPLISGREAYLLTLSSMLTDKAEHNKMLKKLIDDLPKRDPLEQGVSRVMIVGSPVDNLKLLSLIENDLGAWVVADDTCTATRYIWGTTRQDYLDQDPLKAIVDRYLIQRPPCPTKHSPTRWVQCRSCPFRDVCSFALLPSPKEKSTETLPFLVPERICRFRHSLQLGINNSVEGIIAVIQKFCDPHGFDYHHVVQAFEDVGVPSVFLEIDNVLSVGQLKTRVQAFIEMIHPVEYLVEPEIKEGIEIS